jgi:cytochrome b subunit of formate dehydrogenase
MNDSSHTEIAPETAKEAPPQRLTAWQIVSSTIAAAFGVQSSRNRSRDFQAGKPSHFIVAGLVFTVLFVVGMIMLVRLVLSAAT